MNSAIGGNALDFMNTILDPKEIEESNLRVALIGEMIKSKCEEVTNPEKLEGTIEVKKQVKETCKPLN